MGHSCIRVFFSRKLSSLLQVQREDSISFVYKFTATSSCNIAFSVKILILSFCPFCVFLFLFFRWRLLEGLILDGCWKFWKMVWRRRTCTSPIWNVWLGGRLVSQYLPDSPPFWLYIYIEYGCLWSICINTWRFLLLNELASMFTFGLNLIMCMIYIISVSKK